MMTENRFAIGFIGVGLMGTPMVMRLLRAGYEVSVWGRTAAKLEPVIEAGANRVDAAARIAEHSDVILLCVSDTEAVEAVVFGDAGILAGGAPGKLLVDMSSIRPEATIQMAGRLRDEVGVGWIDAPVSGGVVGAENGTLVVMAGGAQHEFEKVRPVLAHLAQRITLMGPCGAGQTTKLVNQLIVGCTVAVVAEATRLAMAAGVDATKIPEALAGGRADSLPLQQWMPKMARRDQTVESHVRTMLKDLDTVLALARATHTALPITAMSAEIHRWLVANGLGEADGTSVFQFYDVGKDT